MTDEEPVTGDEGDGTGGDRARVRQRRHQAPRREHRVSLRLDDDEYELLVGHAQVCGLTPAGFAAETALAAARAGRRPGRLGCGPCWRS